MTNLLNVRRFVVVPAFVVALLAATAHAQDARIRIDHLDRLAKTASEMVDVTVDESLLQLASKFLNEKRSPDEAKVKELISGLKGVFVKRYAFDTEGQFTPGDVEMVRSQLMTPGWARIVGVRSKKKTTIDVDVYLMAEGSLIKGLAVLAVEPKALTVVNVVGPIDLEKLSQLEGKFGIPKLDLITGGGAEKPEPKPPNERQ